MSAARRVQRVERELREVIASYLLSGFKEPLRGLVSVSRVVANKDLRNAKVFISVMGSDEDKEADLLAIQSRMRDIQHQVSSKLRMKFYPKLSFELDKSTDHVIKIERILSEIKDN